MEKKYYIMFKDSGLYQITEAEYNSYLRLTTLILMRIDSEDDSVLVFNLDEPEGFITGQVL